jgi:conjugative transfer signal peptidase TraF
MMSIHQLSRLYLKLIVASALSAGCACEVGAHLVLNRTDSLPRGLYWLTFTRDVHREDVLAFPVPENVRALVHERHYLPDGALLLKPAVAVGGDPICTHAGELRVNGQRYGVMREKDVEGRPLPSVSTCGPVADGYVFVASTHPRSFDSRAFGAVPLDSVRGIARALWIY